MGSIKKKTVTRLLPAPAKILKKRRTAMASELLANSDSSEVLEQFAI